MKHLSIEVLWYVLSLLRNPIIIYLKITLKLISGGFDMKPQPLNVLPYTTYSLYIFSLCFFLALSKYSFSSIVNSLVLMIFYPNSSSKCSAPFSSLAISQGGLSINIIYKYIKSNINYQLLFRVSEFCSLKKLYTSFW